ncbi:MAG: formyltransferase family protein [bacterium]|nr:formyltransferase family protein [bacterium]MDZ4247709.1 formyltransferase family protein [Patescibacteria group bacterium]
MKRIAVLISNKSGGSNLQAMLDGQAEAFDGQVVCVASDKEDAYGLVRAREADVPTITLDHADYAAKGKPRQMYEEALAHKLQKHYPDLVVLAGWTYELSETFLRFFPWRVLSIHPGLLPDPGYHKFKLPDGEFADPCFGLAGGNAMQAVLASGQKWAGSSIFAYTPDGAVGPVLGRGMVSVEDGDTPEKLAARVKPEEHKALRKALAEICAIAATARYG